MSFRRIIILILLLVGATVLMALTAPAAPPRRPVTVVTNYVYVYVYVTNVMFVTNVQTINPVVTNLTVLGRIGIGGTTNIFSSMDVGITKDASMGESKAFFNIAQVNNSKDIRVYGEGWMNAGTNDCVLQLSWGNYDSNTSRDILLWVGHEQHQFVVAMIQNDNILFRVAPNSVVPLELKKRETGTNVTLMSVDFLGNLRVLKNVIENASP